MTTTQGANMKQISGENLDWLMTLAGEAISAGLALSRDAATARLAQIGFDADQSTGVETDDMGQPTMYLLSRETFEDGAPVPLYVFRRRALADKAQRMLQRGSGMQFEILPVPLED
jgi:hypothetical protein